MSGYLIAEEGPFTEEGHLPGQVIAFENGTEWIIGRNPDSADFVLEDERVSRTHVKCRLESGGYTLENLSNVNPALYNGQMITDHVLLKEGDHIRIGDSHFVFTTKNPRETKHELVEESLLSQDAENLSSLSIATPPESRWFLQVTSGLNTGAQFYLQKGQSYTVGKDTTNKDSTNCDIAFQDLSVSKQHLRLTVDENEEHVLIEDLNSRNGTFVNGNKITSIYKVSSSDVNPTVKIGGTSFRILDSEHAFETISSDPIFSPQVEAISLKEDLEEEKNEKDWKEMPISKRHLTLAGLFVLVILASIASLISLFQSSPIEPPPKNEDKFIKEALSPFGSVQYSFNKGSEKLFLSGHVLSSLDKQKLTYELKSLSFIRDIEDNIVIDEYVWKNMNALLATNPLWRGISITSLSPGKFVVKGYLKTADQAQVLSDYLTTNFPYLDNLENMVVVESNLAGVIEHRLQEKNFVNVNSVIVDGDLQLTGKIDGKDVASFEMLLKEFQDKKGIHSVTNSVMYTQEDSSITDISSRYKVTGHSKKDGTIQHIVLQNIKTGYQHVVGLGDVIEDMTIEEISPDQVLLEKEDGLKFSIKYNHLK